ncbi:ABC transporter ATP-binding protein [Amycolatopsis sp.]|uniref:ABC transporter ATP-binding protein n=1 Tax=Amycolatopsis sp. TaxID=37632 RepID=UPI002C567D9B|nr:ABC transporter ATP-binding protein [Amycolatopsis sp.]HVV11192.1 ABC transporter ATP-binding protein [Amycolatopsis sp.]
MTDIALKVENLTVTTARSAELISGVDLTLYQGQLLGLVGETGAGKTLTARAALGLLPRGLQGSGQLQYSDGAILDVSDSEQLARRLGTTAGLMFQNPVGMFDPLQRIGAQLVEAVVSNGLMSKTAAEVRARMLCEDLGLGNGDTLFRRYPHELSGGMCQRAALALTLMPELRLLVIDEPTSALDGQNRVAALRLLQRIARDHDVGILLISHDLNLVSRFCDRLVVMYAGRVAEQGVTTDVLGAPAHPYTATLLSCSLSLDRGKRQKLPTVFGEPPLAGEWPSGCHFHPRCGRATEKCAAEGPALMEIGRREVACHFPG